jgi:aspartate-semialdehyde dehydrogenase
VIIACTLAAALQSFSPWRVVILLFPPVSERGQEGIDELESQTADLLSFRPISQPVFDAQVAFNLLSDYGEASRPKIDDVRAAIGAGISRYIAGRLPLPAIQLVQAPVFYGYAFAAYAEFSSVKDPQEIEAALGAAGVKVAASDSPPTNVSVAGESEIQSARVLRDMNVPAGIWIWGATDNLRLAASNAVQIAEGLLVTPM